MHGSREKATGKERNESMIQVLCPVCGAALSPDTAQWRCENGHCFDVARQGYVNLLPVTQKHSLHPGDTREMVAARREFLDAGYYQPILQTLQALVTQYAPSAEAVLDAGCGEGYYLSGLRGVGARWGIDISKDAVRFAAAREKQAHWLTATATHLPFADGSFDCVLSMFAFTAEAEFRRVLQPDGCFIQVLAGTEHLPALRRIIYPEVLAREKTLHPVLDGFSLCHTQTLRFPFTLNDAAMIRNLLYMTPHVWRIRKENADALARTTHLDEQAEVIFNVYRLDKQGEIC